MQHSGFECNISGIEWMFPLLRHGGLCVCGVCGVCVCVCVCVKSSLAPCQTVETSQVQFHYRIVGHCAGT